MVTHVEMSDQELAELQAATERSEPAEAVRVAMHEYLRYVRRMQLKELSGKVTMEDNWRDLEAAEVDKPHASN